MRQIKKDFTMTMKKKKIPRYLLRKRLPSTGMSETNVYAVLHSPDSDCNSNHTNVQHTTGTGLDSASSFSGSIASSQDFTHDNSDYQWFLEYGCYREPGLHQHVSVLSSLSASYNGIEGLGYYDDIAKNLDANLAEVDMENFRTEDIHSLLSLPPMCGDMPLQAEAERQGEMFASFSASMMSKIDFESSISAQSSSQGDDSAGDTISICKSELLFSPVKETPMPGVNFSVDSLDMLSEQDLILTCQANKNNYTITFEESMTVYSEDSDCVELEKNKTANGVMLFFDKINQQARSRGRPCRQLDTSMARSDMAFTTWSQLKKQSSELQLLRHPSGNNNTEDDHLEQFPNSDYKTHKSQSLPDLNDEKNRQTINIVSKKVSALSNSSVESYHHQIVDNRVNKLFNVRPNQNGGSIQSDLASSYSTCSGSHSHQGHNFSLVKLFMKQKSTSNDGMSICMDQSSECWPASQSEGGDSGDSIGNDIKYKDRHDIEILNSRNKQININTSNTPMISSLNISKTDDKKICNNITTTDNKDTSGIKKSLCNDYNVAFNQCKERHIFNINNNNSFERDTRLPLNNRAYLKLTPKNVSNGGGSQSSNASVSVLSCSSSESSDVTKIQQGCYNLKHSQLTTFPVDCSVQTSFFANSLERQASLKSSQHSDFIKVIEHSFLKKLKHNDENIPIYVMYPNYTLPDLGFLAEPNKTHNVFLRPQQYKEKDYFNNKGGSQKSRRPFSCNDIESLRKKGFNHIRDWDSLTFLLPCEYRQILAEVPEVFQHIKNKEDNLLKPKERPLFCVSPPMRHRLRPVSCDCTSLSSNQTNNISSTSSSATQPSSGYRGSSTMLTDSSSQNSPAQTNNNNPLFVYRYDSITSSEDSLLISEKQHSVHKAPPLPKRSISLPMACQQSGIESPPRPPLPKGILRKLNNCKMHKNNTNCKRYSMCETNQRESTILHDNTKRRSLQETYYLTEENDDRKLDLKYKHRNPKSRQIILEYSDEGIDQNIDTKQSIDTQITNSNILCLNEYLMESDISAKKKIEDWNIQAIMRHRSNVSNFLITRIENDLDSSCTKKTVSFAENALRNELTVDYNKEYSYVTPPNSPNVSAIAHRQYQSKMCGELAIREESDGSPDHEVTSHSQKHIKLISSTSKNSFQDLIQKRVLVSAVTSAVEKIIQHFSTATNQDQLNALGNYSISPACAKLLLSSLCPALYAILSDGLKENIETSFGAINNSVWSVVEASAQLGPITQSLNDLVMRINSIDMITEGLVKFNAFIFGLLNVRSLDAWVSYIRTRESVIKKHYCYDSLLVMDYCGGTTVRSLLDTLLASLEPLSMLPFTLDLMFEYQQLHKNLNRISGHQNSHEELIQVKDKARKECPSLDESSDQSLPDLVNSAAFYRPLVKEENQRPRSFVDHNYSHDIAGTVKKRWSGIQMNSKLFEAFDRLVKDTEEEYSNGLAQEWKPKYENTINGDQESLEENNGITPNDTNEDVLQKGGKFRRLQKKWEMLSGQDTSPLQSPLQNVQVKSRIPRPVMSPNKPPISGIAASPLSPPPLRTKRGIPVPVKKIVSPILPAPHPKKQVVMRPAATFIRTSRVDMQPEVKHIVRPSSLPYKPTPSDSKDLNRAKILRRATSSSQGRSPKVIQDTPIYKRTVRTLSHLLPLDAGHLTFNEGERLKVILEVDSKWLLCCRGSQKGLVPKSAVITVMDR